MTEKQEKKVVGRTVVIALGIICIILAVGLVGAVANYTSIIGGKDSTISSLNSQITTKDNTISNLNSQISSKDSQISSLNSQVTSLQTQVSDLTDTVNLAKSTVWASNEAVNQPAGSYVYWRRSASYAGYVSRLQIWKSNVLADFQQSIAKKVARNLLKNVGSYRLERAREEFYGFTIRTGIKPKDIKDLAQSEKPMKMQVEIVPNPEPEFPK